MRDFVFSIIALLILSTAVAEIVSKQNDKMNAYASRDIDGSYFCDPKLVDFEKADFLKSASHYDDIFKNSGLSPKEVSDLIIGDTSVKDEGLDQLGKMIGCLEKEMGIDYESVYKFSPTLSDGLNYAVENRPEDFYANAPNFASNVFNIVPEFGSAAIIVITISIIGAVIISKRVSN